MEHKAAQLRGQHAIKLYVSTDLKTRLGELSVVLDRPLADICRTLLWMGMPILEGMEAAHRHGRTWWKNKVGGEPMDTLEETT